jgi:monoamine oxidase
MKKALRMPKIVIVGAGMTGLSCALHLAKSGIKGVKHLEARDRPGGRIHGVLLESGPRVELGANWFHLVEHNPLVKIADNLGIEVAEPRRADEAYRHTLLFDHHGQPHSAKTTEQAFHAFMASVPLDKVGSPLWWFQQDEARDIGGGGLEFIPESSLREFSPRENTTDRYVTGGTSTLVQHLADVLDIEYGTRVTHIHNNHLRTSTGQKLDFTHCVVTVPITVLRQLEMHNVSENIINVVQSGLHMATATLIWLHFESAFADPKYRYFGNTNPGARYALWVLPPRKDSHLMFAFVTGHAALEAQDRPQEEVLGWAVDELRTLFPKLPKLLGGRVSSWHKDPFSQGCWSYVANGKAPQHIWGSHETVLYAGEATASYGRGTILGAWNEGKRAAEHIISQIS